MVGLNAQMQAQAFAPGVPTDGIVAPDGTTPLANVGFGCCFGATGILTIGSTQMNCPAWDIPNLARLWAEAAVRGGNQLLPTRAGVRGYPTRLDETSFDLKLFITGDVDALGGATASPWLGLEANMDALFAGVFDPITIGRGTRTAILTMPEGAPRMAQVQVAPLAFAAEVDDPSFVEATMTITVVSGRFV